MSQPTKLYTYQRKGVRLIEVCDGRTLLADEMGLGKTIQVVKYIDNFLDPCDLTVVVCPANVKYQWAREALVHCGLEAEVLEHKTPPKFWKPRPGVKILIVSYNTLYPLPKNGGRSWCKVLKKLHPMLVVGDEIQKVKSRNSKAYKWFRKLCTGVPKLIGTSGTPAENDPCELWPFLNLCWPEKFKSFHKFAWTYTKPEKTPWGYRFTKARNCDKLNKRLLRAGMIRRLKCDVLKDLPAVRHGIVPVPISNRKEYLHAKNDFVDWLKKNGKFKFKGGLQAVALSKANYLLRLIATLKYQSIVEWLETFLEDSTGKLAVFGTHNKDFLLPLYQKFKSYGVLITGKVTGHKRELAKQQFVEDKRKRLLFANAYAVGVGVDGLQRGCDRGLIAQLPWNPAVLGQVVARLHRLGQKNPVDFTYLLAKDTVEEKVLDALNRKQQTMNQVLDGKGNGDDAAVYEELMSGLLKGKW